MSIDRIDGTKGYSPDNCRWADTYTQARNQKNAKLSAEQVMEIRKRYIPGKVSQQSLADEFGVSQPMIGNIVRNDAWVLN